MADRNLEFLTANEQRVIEEGIAVRLRNEPNRLTKAIKRLRSNPFAEYELRIGDYRVLYNVDAEKGEVEILAIGQKVGNKLIVEGKEFHEHKSHTTE